MQSQTVPGYHISTILLDEMTESYSVPECFIFCVSQAAPFQSPNYVLINLWSEPSVQERAGKSLLSFREWLKVHIFLLEIITNTSETSDFKKSDWRADLFALLYSSTWSLLHTKQHVYGVDNEKMLIMRKHKQHSVCFFFPYSTASKVLMPVGYTLEGLTFLAQLMEP